MINKNYSSEIRKYILGQYNFVKNFFDNNKNIYSNEDMIDNVYLSSLDSIEENLPIRHMILSKESVTIEDLKNARLFAILSRIQMYTDYYRYLKFQDINQKTNLIDNFCEVKSYKDIKNIFSDKIAAKEMIESSLEFNKSSGYDKVLFTKCLDYHDREHLLRINPFSEYELKNYDVNVDLNFIDRHLKKWQKSFPNDIDKSYDEASSFIIDLYNINKDEGLKIIGDLFDKLGKTFIENYEPDKDSSIKVNGVVLDHLLLKQILHDYDEENNYTLKYNNGDTNGNK